MHDVILKMSNISKRFPGTLALDNFGIDVCRGEVHVLLGENGAGKSTLVKIISGVYTRDSGEMIFYGENCNFKDVKQAQSKGIGIIHQELNLLPERTVAQNIFVGREPMIANLPFVIDEKKMNKEASKILDDIGLKVDPKEKIKNLSIAQQQMVEVAKAMSQEIRLLIMDEPTSSLTSKEIDRLFDIINYLKEQDVTIIYISHRMDEIQRIGDRVTIMRDGKYVDTVSAKNMDVNDVIKKMVGRKIENMYARNINEKGNEVLRTEKLTGLRFRDADIVLHEGEIVSLSGLVGAGRTEIAKVLFGYDKKISGKIFLFGKEIDVLSPQKCVNSGLAFLPEDRKAEGLHLLMPVKNNIVMASLNKIFTNRILNGRLEDKIGSEQKDLLNISTPNVDTNVINLSGGNQQKVVIGKWLSTNCKVFIFDEPTRGIDVGAKAEIYELIDDLASNGAAVLIISSELNEVIGLSDRVYVMCEGEITKELQRNELTQETLLKYAIRG